MSPVGIISIVLVDFIHIDLSHQTVCLIAALLLPQPDIGVVHLGPLDGALVGSLVCIEVDHDEALFWKNTFCPLSLSGVASGNTRMHAEYKITGCMTPSYDGEKPVVCSCSASVFPKDYPANTTFFNDFTEFVVWVPIPVIFVSPISKYGVSVGSSNSSSDLF